MKRMLLRSGKDPFTPVSAEATLTQDVFNSNAGNYLFQHAIWKALATPDFELVSNGTLSERDAPQAGDAARINEEFDSFVIPLANAFRPEFAQRLDNLTELLQDVTIPVTVIGVGAQTGLGLETEELASIADTVKAFVGAVLDRSASIGVRGEFTKTYLKSLGFPDESIDIIGCPSLFLHGPDLHIDKPDITIDASSRLALNLTPEVRGIAEFAHAQIERYPLLEYVGQDAHDLRLLLWGVPSPVNTDERMPLHLGHQLYQEDRIRLFLDTWTWYDYLAAKDFTYGTRFHGNVAGLLARKPAMLLAHDSRTLELADYHAMPYVRAPQLSAEVDAAALYEATDLAPFNAAMKDRFGRYTSFLEKNDLQHIWQDGSANPAFDERLAAAAFPPPVHPLTKPDGAEIAARLQWLREGQLFDGRQPSAYKHPFPHPPRRYPADGPRKKLDDRFVNAKVRNAELLAAQKTTIDALAKRIKQLEQRTFKARARRAYNKLKRALHLP
ncbi:polysaccharide pyruvyl transferase family protein [soil metagenome]